MAAKKQQKVITRRKKFIKVDIPTINSQVELIGESPKQVENKTIKLDLTRQLKGKSVEGTFRIKIEEDKPIAQPFKIRLMPYFIRRMIRKRISYVEDSFEAPTQNSLIKIKPFIITRKRVSRAVRKTIRNKAKNWIEDYLAERTDEEIFNEILSNKFQRPLSLTLKKTYPLSLCEIRILQIVRPLKPEEVPKITKKKKIEITETPSKIEEGLDQFKEIEEEKIKKAEKEMKETQEKATKKEGEDKSDLKKDLEEAKKKIAEKKKAKEEKEKEKKE
ncbi:hypothetical protein CMI42_03915 [Candidatus Pacearchaeota archaeon]|nr:hypothetical protein [Candidatus Pacearchaeota archaeon]|tara:strand:+ start:20 stop:844 length:825 start_codon:yes stop_codon:yes gene_type:complete